MQLLITGVIPLRNAPKLRRLIAKHLYSKIDSQLTLGRVDAATA